MNLEKAKTDGRFWRWAELIGDLVLVNFSYYAAFMIRYQWQPKSYNIEPFYAMIPFLTVSTFFILTVFHINSQDRKTYISLIYAALFASTAITITAVAIAFFIRGFSFPRTVFLLAFFIQLLLFLIWKVIGKKLADSLRIKKKTMIIGPADDAVMVAHKMMKTHGNEFWIQYIADSINQRTLKLMQDIDVVVLCDHLGSEQKSEMISYCLGKQKTVFILPELFEITLLGADVQQFDDMPAFHIDDLTLSVENRIVKRLMDILVSTIGLVLLSPVMVAITVKIRLHDSKPALFTQERATRDNQLFKLYKFRTMVHDAEIMTGPVLASDKDPRLLPFGEFLRSTRLDELPQLFNVLAGEMSIVGPRPERPFFIEQYVEDIPEFKYRLSVKSGITGLAQVSGKYTTTPQDKLRFDLLYIRNYSLLLDLKIILQTIRTILTKEQAAGQSIPLTMEEMLAELDCTMLNKNRIFHDN